MQFTPISSSLIGLSFHTVSLGTYFFIMKSIIRHMDSRRAAMIGPMTHIIVASSMFLSTDTSGSIGPSGFGRFGGSPGGTSRMSKDRCSENGLDVYRCWNSHNVGNSHNEISYLSIFFEICCNRQLAKNIFMMLKDKILWKQLFKHFKFLQYISHKITLHLNKQVFCQWKIMYNI